MYRLDKIKTKLDKARESVVAEQLFLYSSRSIYSDTDLNKYFQILFQKKIKVLQKILEMLLLKSALVFLFLVYLRTTSSLDFAIGLKLKVPLAHSKHKPCIWENCSRSVTITTTTRSHTMLKHNQKEPVFKILLESTNREISLTRTEVLEFVKKIIINYRKFKIYL